VRADEHRLEAHHPEHERHALYIERADAKAPLRSPTIARVSLAG
jgi:hypothetical protein